MKLAHKIAALRLGEEINELRSKGIFKAESYINRKGRRSIGAYYLTSNMWYFRKLFVDLWKVEKLWCGYCNKKFNLSLHEYPTLDHIIPKSKNGSNNIRNLIPCCKTCNKKKGDKEWTVKFPVEGFGVEGKCRQ